jgi:hypothetical protein
MVFLGLLLSSLDPFMWSTRANALMYNATIRVCQILLDKFCNLPISKKNQVKKELISNSMALTTLA